MYNLLLEYYYKTELYDKEIGGMLMPNGEYAPVGRKQKTLSNTYAVKERTRLGLSKAFFDTEEAKQLSGLTLEELENRWNSRG